MAEIGKPVREWSIEESPIPNVPQPEPQKKEEETKVPQRELEKVGASAISQEDMNYLNKELDLAISEMNEEELDFLDKQDDKEVSEDDDEEDQDNSWLFDGEDE